MIDDQSAWARGEALAGWPADFSRLIAEETDKWSKVIRAAEIKAE